METIIINKNLNNKDIYISQEQLSKIKSKRVQISIKGIDDSAEKSELMKFAGVISKEEADELLKNISDGRKIDIESW